MPEVVPLFGELVRCEVLTDIPIVDRVTGFDVEKGDVVQLDPCPVHLSVPPPGTTRVELLAECGLVKVLPREAPAAKPRKEL